MYVVCITIISKTYFINDMRNINIGRKKRVVKIYRDDKKSLRWRTARTQKIKF